MLILEPTHVLLGCICFPVCGPATRGGGPDDAGGGGDDDDNAFVDRLIEWVTPIAGKITMNAVLGYSAGYALKVNYSQRRKRD